MTEYGCSTHVLASDKNCFKCQRKEFELYCVHSMVKWWCLGCVQGHARRLEALIKEMEKASANSISGDSNDAET